MYLGFPRRLNGKIIQNRIHISYLALKKMEYETRIELTITNQTEPYQLGKWIWFISLIGVDDLKAAQSGNTKILVMKSYAS